MSTEIQLAQLAADDALLDRLGALRGDGAHEPVAALLSAVARHADTPLRPGPASRPFRTRRALTALTALVVGASGAGVAAAVTRSDGWSPPLRPRATVLPHVARPPVASPISPGLPAPTRTVTGRTTDDYALVRDAAGRIVLVPQRVVVSSEREQPETPDAARPLVVAAAGSERRSRTVRTGGSADADLRLTLLLAPHPEAELKPAAGEDVRRPGPRSPDDPDQAEDPTMTVASVPAELSSHGSAAQHRPLPTPPERDHGAAADRTPAGAPVPPRPLADAAHASATGVEPVTDENSTDGRSTDEPSTAGASPVAAPATPDPSTGVAESGGADEATLVPAETNVAPTGSEPTEDPAAEGDVPEPARAGS